MLNDSPLKRRQSNAFSFAMAAAGLLLLSGCGVLPKGHSSFDVSAKDRGVASWYGEDFHGKLAADGRPFDMYGFTGAHRSLPLGTVVRVLNAQNGRSVFIRITDRGPYKPGRMIDLSMGAAQHLGMVKKGLSPVLVDVVGEGPLLEQLVAARGKGLLTISAAEAQASMDTSPGPQGLFPSRPAARHYPGDLWGLRRLRRVADVLAADHHVDRLVAVLLVA